MIETVRSYIFFSKCIKNKKLILSEVKSVKIKESSFKIYILSFLKLNYAL